MKKRILPAIPTHKRAPTPHVDPSTVLSAAAQRSREIKRQMAASAERDQIERAVHRLSDAADAFGSTGLIVSFANPPTDVIRQMMDRFGFQFDGGGWAKPTVEGSVPMGSYALQPAKKKMNVGSASATRKRT